MDIALCLDILVPGGNWQGSVTANTRKAYEAVRWNDARPKPSWADIEAQWAIEAAKPPPAPPRNMEQEIDDLKTRITALETKQEVR